MSDPTKSGRETRSPASMMKWPRQTKLPTLRNGSVRSAPSWRGCRRNTHPTTALQMYRGNSASWIYSKAENYKKALGRVWDALREHGIQPDGKTHCTDAVSQALRLSREASDQ